MKLPEVFVFLKFNTRVAAVQVSVSQLVKLWSSFPKDAFHHTLITFSKSDTEMWSNLQFDKLISLRFKLYSHLFDWGCTLHLRNSCILHLIMDVYKATSSTGTTCEFNQSQRDFKTKDLFFFQISPNMFEQCKKLAVRTQYWLAAKQVQMSLIKKQ